MLMISVKAAQQSARNAQPVVQEGIKSMHNASRMHCDHRLPGSFLSERSCTTYTQSCHVVITASSLQGIVHRDVKASNLMYDSQGTVRLSDFGIAHDTTKGPAWAHVGTLDYQAPEVGPIDWHAGRSSAALHQMGCVSHVTSQS